MFTFSFYSTKTKGWTDACRSSNPKKVLAAFDEVAGQRTIPAVTLRCDGDVVLRLGLSNTMTMKIAIWQSQMVARAVYTERKRELARERFFRHRAKGVKAVKAGRNKLLNALVV